MKHQPLRLLSLVLLVLSASGWGTGRLSTPPATGTRPTDVAQSNKVRRDLGIRQIKTGWQYDGLTADAATCDTWQVRQRLGWRNGKTVEHDKDRRHILWERDYYYSDAVFTDTGPDNGMGEELLVIDYDYGRKRFLLDYVGIDSSIKSLFDDLQMEPDGPPGAAGQSSGYTARTNEDTLAVADKVLAKWHLSRR